MAKTSALNIVLENGSTPAELLEVFGQVIENVEKMAVSTKLKSQNFSGDPAAGSVVFQRYENAVSAPYGTARTAGEGAKLQTKPVVVNLDIHNEIIEEFEEFDLHAFGDAGLLAKRSVNIEKSMVRQLDTEFFAEGYATGTKVSHTASTWDGKLEELFVTLETVSNSFVDGVDRADIACVVTPAVYSAIRLFIDTIPAQDNFYNTGAVGSYHGIPVFSSNRLPKAAGQVVDAMVMRVDSIAQPTHIFQPAGAYKIEQSKAFSLDLFWDNGIGALTPDLIFYSGDTYSAS